MKIYLIINKFKIFQNQQFNVKYYKLTNDNKQKIILLRNYLLIFKIKIY
jgi:hypothetical protein